jgi:hypothetical protein
LEGTSRLPTEAVHSKARNGMIRRGACREEDLARVQQRDHGTDARGHHGNRQGLLTQAVVALDARHMNAPCREERAGHEELGPQGTGCSAQAGRRNIEFSSHAAALISIRKSLAN